MTVIFRWFLIILICCLENKTLEMVSTVSLSLIRLRMSSVFLIRLSVLAMRALTRRLRLVRKRHLKGLQRSELRKM